MLFSGLIAALDGGDISSKKILVWKLPSYPSPNPILPSPIPHLRQNVGLGEGQVDSFLEFYTDFSVRGLLTRQNRVTKNLEMVNPD